MLVPSLSWQNDHSDVKTDKKHVFLPLSSEEERSVQGTASDGRKTQLAMTKVPSRPITRSRPTMPASSIDRM